MPCEGEHPWGARRVRVEPNLNAVSPLGWQERPRMWRGPIDRAAVRFRWQTRKNSAGTAPLTALNREWRRDVGGLAFRHPARGEVACQNSPAAAISGTQDPWSS